MNDAVHIANITATLILIAVFAAMAVPIYTTVQIVLTTRALTRRMDRFAAWHRAQCERWKAGLLTPEEVTALKNITLMVIARREWDYRNGPWEEEP